MKRKVITKLSRLKRLYNSNPSRQDISFHLVDYFTERPLELGSFLASGNYPLNLSVKLGGTDAHVDNVDDNLVLDITKALSNGTLQEGLELDLSGNDLTDRSATACAEFLAGGFSPEKFKLSLSGNSAITAEGIKALANALKSGMCRPGLTLDFTAMDLDDISIEAIADALASGNCPHSLQLDLVLTNAQVAILAGALQSEKCPENLRINLCHGNQVTEEGIASLASALDSGKCPKGLQFKIPAHYFSYFVPSLQRGRCPEGFALELYESYRFLSVVGMLAELIAKDQCPPNMSVAFVRGDIYNAELQLLLAALTSRQSNQSIKLKFRYNTDSADLQTQLIDFLKSESYPAGLYLDLNIQNYAWGEQLDKNDAALLSVLGKGNGKWCLDNSTVSMLINKNRYYSSILRSLVSIFHRSISECYKNKRAVNLPYSRGSDIEYELYDNLFTTISVADLQLILAGQVQDARKFFIEKMDKDHLYELALSMVEKVFLDSSALGDDLEYIHSVAARVVNEVYGSVGLVTEELRVTVAKYIASNVGLGEITQANFEAALRAAAAEGDIRDMELLVAYVKNINAVDRQGKTALHYAAARCPACFNFLIERNADSTIQDELGCYPMDRYCDELDSNIVVIKHQAARQNVADRVADLCCELLQDCSLDSIQDHVKIDHDVKVGVRKRLLDCIARLSPADFKVIEGTTNQQDLYPVFTRLIGRQMLSTIVHPILGQNDKLVVSFLDKVYNNAFKFKLLCTTKDKAQFLGDLRNFLGRADISRATLLDLFDELKDRRGRYQFIHEQRNPSFDRLRLFFKSNKNHDEANFWHTNTYQQAVKMLKDAYIERLDKDESVDPDMKSKEDSLLDYVRGNSPIHRQVTTTRQKVTALAAG